MSTPLIPQEIYLLERYSSLNYFGEMRDAWAAMVAASDDALDHFMRHLPPDYRSRPLHQQPDAVWGERVLPNLRWTLESLNTGYAQLASGDWEALGFAGNAVTAQAGIWRDYDIDWMSEPYKSIFDAQEGIASERASNVKFTTFAAWVAGDLSTLYHSDSRGPLNPPSTWPVYRLNPSVRVRTGDKVSRNGIYLPDAEDSAAQAIGEGYEAWEANIGYDPDTMQRRGKAPTVWTLVERIADEGGGIPGPTGEEGIVGSQRHRLNILGGQPCPQSGWWFTPAKTNSRRYFKAGEVMPIIEGSNYGATVWQWDIDQSTPKL